MTQWAASPDSFEEVRKKLRRHRPCNVDLLTRAGSFIPHGGLSNQSVLAAVYLALALAAVVDYLVTRVQGRRNLP